MKQKPFIIGISGATGSGKTWFARELQALIPNKACIFTLDSYYKDIQFVSQLKYRHDNPDAIDFEAVLHDFEQLISGNAIAIPNYDYDTHQVISTTIMKPSSIIILEGLFAFSNEQLRNLMDYRIWIEAETNTRLLRRVRRDVTERGDTQEGATERFNNDAEPAYQELISKNSKYADCFIFNNGNNHSAGIFQLFQFIN